jgi:hypothetical protein
MVGVSILFQMKIDPTNNTGEERKTVSRNVRKWKKEQKKNTSCKKVAQ